MKRKRKKQTTRKKQSNKKMSEYSGFTIAIRVFGNGDKHNDFINIRENMTIKEVKERVAKKLDIDQSEKKITVVICGEEVKDEQTCEELEVCSITCPHIIIK